MGDKWKDAGGNPHGLNVVKDVLDTVAGHKTYTVENEETGEFRNVVVDERAGQTLGDAISKGQWEDDKK